MLDRNEMVLRDERYAPQAMAPYMPPQMPQFMPPPEPEEPSLIASILRHKWIVAICMAFCITLGFIFLKKTTPLYLSQSKIWIESVPVINPQGDQPVGATGGGNYLNTQTSLMKSPLIVSTVLNRPEIASLRSFKGAIPIAYLHDNLQADVGKTDDLITVSILTPRPEDSAAIVNAVVTAYHDYQTSSKNDRFGAVINELTPEQEKLQADIDKNQAALDDLRLKNPSISFQENAQPNTPATILMNADAQHYAEIRARRIDVQILYGSENQQLKTLLAQEQQAMREFQAAQKIATDTTTLQNSVQDQYARLKSDIDQERQVLKPLTDRINQLNQQRDLFKNIRQITVTEPAVPATLPAYPVPAQVLALAGLVGMIFGGFLAYLRDRTDNRLRTAEEIQDLVGLQILGVVPRMPGRRTSVARAMSVHLDPRSEVAEAYRTIRTAVYFGFAGTRARTLLVTSPEAGDGKTTSASNLAIAIAQTGRTVLLLDADFRKPTQHKNLDVNDAIGLSSVLSGTETLDRAIQRTGVDGLDILPCGAIPGNPSEILNSQEFGELVDRLALKYDHIIFDSPPVNLVTDARILGAVCDATVLVLRAEKSTRKGAEHARNALMSVGAKVIGAIVNDAARGKGYETYGGSYYGTAGMRAAGAAYSTPVSPMRPPSGGYLPRSTRGESDVAEG